MLTWVRHFNDSGEDKEVQSIIDYINGLETKITTLTTSINNIEDYNTLLFTNSHIISANTILAAATSVYIIRYIEISEPYNLEIGLDSDLEVA